MTNNSVDDRRRFSRINFNAYAHLRACSGEVTYLQCDVIDISLNGLLINRPKQWESTIDDEYNVDLVLDNAQIVIKMHCRVVHVTSDCVGFQCQQLDIDSMTHLRKLLLLNLGDESLAERELSALIEQD